MASPPVTRPATCSARGTLQGASPIARSARLPLDWLAQDPALARLAAAANRLKALQTEVEKALAPLKVQVLALESGRLLLSAPHAAAAARLRQREPSLVRQLVARGWPVTEVSFRPPRGSDPIPMPPGRLKTQPNADALVTLGQLADRVRHPELARALRRFAQRHAPSAVASPCGRGRDDRVRDSGTDPVVDE